MTPISSISIVIILMTLLVLIGSSFISSGFKNVHKAVYLISGFIQDGMFKSSNAYDYNKYYDNYVRVSADNNKKESTDDLCGKLLEGCQKPTTESNASTETESQNKSVEEIYKKYIEPGSVKNKTVSEPASVENKTVSQPIGGPQFTENLSQTHETGPQLYDNSKLGIKLSYPAGWEKKEEPTGDSVRFFSAREDNNDSYIRTIDLFSYPSVSVDQATKSLTNYYNSSLNNFTIEGSPRASVNANFSSVSLNYTYNDDKAGLIRSMDFIISPPSNNKTYLFTFRDEASRFDKDLPEVQRMINSVNFSR
jgi:hypothetical protein